MSQLPLQEMTGVLHLVQWAKSGKGKPYLVFTIGEEAVCWFFFGQIDAGLVGQEVTATVAVGEDRKFLKSVLASYREEEDFDTSIEAVQAIWDTV